MKKMVLSAFVFAASVLATHAQLLYKVSGDSLRKPSYVFATYRLINPVGTVERVAGLRDALNNTEQMDFEVNKSAYTNTLADARKLKGGQMLKNLLTPSQLALLDKFLKKYTEVGFNSPYSQRRYADITPAGMEEELEKLLFVANHMSEYDPTHTFDQYFEAQAKKNHEPVYGLSTCEEFTACGYEAPLDKQVKSLVNFLENEQVHLAELNKTADAFTAQDIDAVTKATSHVCGKKIARWTKALPAIMQAAPTFVVLEAAYLGGENGLLQQLRKAGYTVEAVR